LTIYGSILSLGYGSMSELDFVYCTNIASLIVVKPKNLFGMIWKLLAWTIELKENQLAKDSKIHTLEKW
jgi:hypothetical protein